MRTKLFPVLQAVAVGILIPRLTLGAPALTDYGAIPAITLPQGDQSAANQKLDFHTDLFTGRFNYSIPITVPPARGGSQPAIALQYNSANKNGWCGVGWDLDMGYIQRETRKGVPVSSGAYADSFGFVFSVAGQSGRLVKAADGLYRPEVNTGFLVFSYSGGYWVVTDKSGRKYTFGETLSSRITNSSFGSFKWALSKVHDPNGNTTTVSYQTVTPADGQLYLSEIDYNGNDNTNSPISATCSVTFTLESSARSDLPSSCLSGFEIYTSRRLQAITVLNGVYQVRNYSLAYTSSASTGRSLLTGVTENGIDGSWAWPSIGFSYSQQTNSFQPVARWNINPQVSGSAYWTSPASPDTQLVDINGDGLPDFVSRPLNSPYDHFVVQLNNGSGFNSATSWSGVSEENGHNDAAHNTLDASDVSGLSRICSLVDVNGDLLPDRVVISTGTADHIQVQTNTGTAFASTADWSDSHSLGPNEINLLSSGATYTLGLLADINGDGLADRVVTGGATNEFGADLNQGGSFYSNKWTGVIKENSPRARTSSDVFSELIDLNGDGLPDHIFSSGAQLNNGLAGSGVSGFGSFLTWGLLTNESPETIDITDGVYTKQLIDMNGDGLPDLVTESTGGLLNVWFNTGRGFSSTGVVWSGTNSAWYGLQAWDSTSTIVSFSDVNGDGLPDRIIRNYLGGSDCLLVQLNSGPMPDLLTSIDNGMGGIVTVTYKPSTQYDNSDGTRSRLPMVMYTVESVTVDDGIRTVGTTSYKYRYGLYDTAYREFRGFGVVDEADPLGMTNETYFHQGGGRDLSSHGEYQDSRFKAGMAYDVLTYGWDGQLYKETLSQVEQVRLDTNGIYFPFVTNVFTFDVEVTNGPSRARLKQFAYDVTADNLAASTGNLLKESDLGEVTNVTYTYTYSDVTDAPVYTAYTYASIPSNSDIRDRPATITVNADSAGWVVLRQTTNQFYDVTGNLKSKSDRICAGSYAVTSYGYDNYGNVTSTTNPVGIVTTVSYDSAATFPWRSYTGPLSSNLVEYTLHDARNGALLASTNMQGMVTSNSYDGLLRLTNTSISTVSNGSPTLWRTRYEYSLARIGFPITTNYVRLMKNDPADPVHGYHETYTYLDGLGRPIQVRDESETNGYRVVDVFRDPRGGVLSESYPIFSSGSAYVGYTATLTNTYTVFDPIGRPYLFYPAASAPMSQGNLTEYPTPLTGDSGSPVGPTSIAFYDGNDPWTIIITNALGKIHKYSLDAFGRTNQIIEVTSGGNYTSSLAYDQVGNLTNLTDSASNQIAFFYNDLGEKVAMADPDMGFWQYGLDVAGRLKVQTDAKGNVIQFDYTDPAGRLKTKLGYNRQGALVSTVTNYYDSSLGDAAYTVYPGQLFMTSDDEGWTKHSYDVRGRELKTVRYVTRNLQTYTNSYTYDDADRQITMTYPNGGPTITNIYDLGGHYCRAKLVGGAATLYYDAQAFNELDQLTGINFGNGAATTFKYYKTSKRLNQITTTASSTTIQNLTNRYDAVGNVIGVQDLVTGHTGTSAATMTNAVYDDLNRLTSAGWTGYGLKSYAYDKVGNVLTNGESGAAEYTYYSLRPHSATNANGTWFTYDLNGNVAFRGGQRLEHDVNNRLSIVLNTNGTVTTFGYAADGSRLWEQGGTNSLQVWIGSSYEEKSGQVLYHVTAPGKLVCTFDKTGTNVFQYHHPDYLTSTSIQTDTNGSVVQHYEYTAFGQTRYTQSSTVFAVSRRYTSQVLDEGTGLYYYNARYYDPQLGRFVEADDVIPNLDDPQSWNRYAYVLNNPLRFNDPAGHTPFDVIKLNQAAARMAALHGRDWQTYEEAARELGIGNAGQIKGGTEAIQSIARTAGAAADTYATALPDLATAGLVTAPIVLSKAGRTAAEEGVSKGTRILENSATGVQREAKTAAQLAAENPGKVIQKERLLRDASGKKVVDPITGEGRRVDHAVIDREANIAVTYETTGRNVNKAEQLAKEQRIRDAGGTYIRDKETRKLVPVQGTSDLIRHD